ncbi:MAG TPA: alpha/beta fold hydrolase [Gammaproteobacteria bacterium]
MTRLILLPAFDGTGLMFAPFVRELKNRFAAWVISYPLSGPQDYAALARYVRRQIPENEHYILLGESFAGPLVYEIAMADPLNCKAAVFVATYLTNPRPWFLKILAMLPATIISRFVSSRLIVRLLSLSSKADGSVAKAIAENFASVEPILIKQRLRTIGSLGPDPQSIVEIPCCYLQAGKDRLVPAHKLKDFRKLCPALEVKQVEGGHFILQEQPEACAAAVASMLQTIG